MKLYLKKFSKKLFVCIIICFCFTFFSFATTAEYKGENYNIKLVYNKEFSPGDPVFVKMQFKFLKKLSRQENSVTGKIRLQKISTDESIRNSTIFEMKSNKKIVLF